MEQKTIEKTIKETIYVAMDGKVFNDPRSCQDYEIKLQNSQFKEEMKKYIITQAQGVYPIGVDFLSDQNNYTWYKVETKEVKDKIMTYLGYTNDILENIEYPTIICLEETSDDIYIYDIKNSFKNMEIFLRTFLSSNSINKEQIKGLIDISNSYSKRY